MLRYNPFRVGGFIGFDSGGALRRRDPRLIAAIPNGIKVVQMPMCCNTDVLTAQLPPHAWGPQIRITTGIEEFPADEAPDDTQEEEGLGTEDESAPI